MNVPVLFTHSYRGGTLRLGRAAPEGAPPVPVVDAAPDDGSLHILRSAIPSWVGGNHGEYVALEHIYERLLVAASRQGRGVLTVPLVLDEASGFPLERAIRVVFSTVFRFFREHTEPPRDVTLVIDATGAYDLSAHVLAIAARTYLGTSTTQN